MKITKRLCALMLLGTALSPALTAATTPPSIATSFETFWKAAQGQPFERQEALWDSLIEQPRQELYDQVVWEKRDNTQWQKDKTLGLKYRFAKYPAISGQIPEATRALETQIPLQVARFRKLFPDASAKPRVAVVLAPDFDSKSGVMADGKPVLALAIDTLILEKADLSILFPHELFHLYDAMRTGISNDGVMPDTQLTLPLFEEGFATYVSTLVSPGKPDAQYLFQNDLGALPPTRLPDAARRFLQTADQPTLDPAHHSMNYARWFEGNITAYQKDLPNRSGYWLGLNLVRQMAKSHTLNEMAAWGPAKAQQETLAALKVMAATP
ncbi:MAG TPA: hypothetical protein VLV87_10290 [Gammaproteobacteria bacterium]|nr:hypothetical protein [Gammaproteobacteria bacterium]